MSNFLFTPPLALPMEEGRVRQAAGTQVDRLVYKNWKVQGDEGHQTSSTLMTYFCPEILG